MVDVLYIEDNPDDIDIFKRVVRKIDQPPTYCVLNNGVSAIRYLTEEETPRMLLLDLNLPGAGGLDVLQQVRAGERYRNLPIVVYSTSDNPRDMRQAFDFGANAYLVKPGGYRETSEMLRRAIDFWVAQNDLSNE